MEILGGALAWSGPAHTASGNRQDDSFFSKTKGSSGETNTHFKRYFTGRMSAFLGDIPASAQPLTHQILATSAFHN
jgi:hypothetical protein